MTQEKVEALNYRSAGVDVEAGDRLVDWLRAKKEPWPHQDQIVSGIGGFASLFRLPLGEMSQPCLVTCTDGVGTKVKLAAESGNYQGLGQDLVAMCVNDLICSGAKPLLFLDYYATGRLDLTAAQAFLASVSQACRDADCALVGGETAEMPGVYQGNDFDCAGFAVGLVDEAKAWGAHRVQAGDRVFAFSSSGFHSNGYSLLRRVFAEDLPHWQEELLKPTALYVNLVKRLQTQAVEIHAAAHITGGGIDNIPRVLPEGWQWNRRDWPWPSPFREVQRRTGLSDEEMMKTLNCGIGFCVITRPQLSQTLEPIAKALGFHLFDLGEVQP
ncbi:MAG: phosphoribosylformylglycinamidine cyclo-ligase [Bdellovibrio sp.]|nr:MAG: phosphoribosylformylglycinamidine cyclo-ligase [Bdellovibrio sp.]